MPFLIGLDQETNDTYLDIPLEVMRVNLDRDKVLIGDVVPKVPATYYKLLHSRLKAAVPFTLARPDPILDAVDQAFNVVLIDPDEQVDFNFMQVRDAVFEFMTRILKGYEKLIVSSASENDRPR